MTDTITLQKDAGLTLQGKGCGCLTWLEERRVASGIGVRPIGMNETQRWPRGNGCFEHETGRFFSIVGVRGTSNAFPSGTMDQPIILQPEIGILGILVRRKHGESQILVQAKAEPGNVGGVQLAPTVQATVSNYECVHGGHPTPYLDYFRNIGPWCVPADSRQSEQGTRFLGKFNRNMTVLVNGHAPDPVSDVWRWCDAQEILRALGEDFCVNTDLRSVLATSDWSVFSPGPAPFFEWRGRGGFGEALYESCTAPDPEPSVKQILARLSELRDSVKLNLEIVPIQELAGWRMDDQRLVDTSEDNFEVRCYRVKAPDREVTGWDQPLVRDLDQGEVILAGQRREGILHFLLRGRTEIGFREKVQYGPSVQKPLSRLVGSRTPPDDPVDDIILSEDHIEYLRCRLSEEGGRFYMSTCLYRVIEFSEEVDFPEFSDCSWVTLGQLHRLIKIPGILTNELRSAIAILLSWLPGPE